MKAARWLLVMALFSPVSFASCGRGEEAAPEK